MNEFEMLRKASQEANIDFQKIKSVGYLVVLVVILIGAFSCFYQVPFDSKAVVQRFGKWISTEEPGLHFKIPFGVDQVTIVQTQRQMKMEFGYGSRGSTNPYQYATSEREQYLERQMVTGDLNSVEIEWVVQYHIHDVKAYLFYMANPEETLRDLSESILREIVGDRTIDEVLTIGRQDMQENILLRLKDLTDKLNTGLKIDQVQLGNINPPPQVRSSFSQVTSSQQERESLINNANKEYNRVIPEARGNAQRQLSSAEGYALERINNAKGDVARFNDLLKAYALSPEVTRKRIYLETISEILAPIPNKTIIDDKLQNFLPLLNLSNSATQPLPPISSPRR
jgi:membrane protease subunit HflK